MLIDKPGLEDAERIAAVHVQAWQESYRGLIPDPLLDNLSAERRENWWRQQLANPGSEVIRVVKEAAGEIVGFTSFGPNREPNLSDSVAELYTIYLLKAFWGRGMGRALLQAAVYELTAAGYTHLSLWVLHNNQRGIEFYRKAGFKPAHEEKTIDAAGVPLREVRYQRPLGD